MISVPSRYSTKLPGKFAVKQGCQHTVETDHDLSGILQEGDVLRLALPGAAGQLVDVHAQLTADPTPPVGGKPGCLQFEDPGVDFALKDAEADGFYGTNYIDGAARIGNNPIDHHTLKHYQSGDVEQWDAAAIVQALTAMTPPLMPLPTSIDASGCTVFAQIKPMSPGQFLKRRQEIPCTLTDAEVVKYINDLARNRAFAHAAQYFVDDTLFNDIVDAVRYLINTCLAGDSSLMAALEGVLKSGQEATDTQMKDLQVKVKAQKHTQRRDALIDNVLSPGRDCVGRSMNNMATCSGCIGRTWAIDAFRRWLAIPPTERTSVPTRVFAVVGDTSTGKSVLVAQLVRLVQNEHGTCTTAVHLFDCDHVDQRDPNSALRAIAIQLLQAAAGSITQQYCDGVRMFEHDLQQTSDNPGAAPSSVSWLRVAQELHRTLSQTSPLMN